MLSKLHPWLPVGLQAKRSIGVTLDGVGTVLTTGVKGYEAIPFSGIITGWRIDAAESGDCTIDVWKRNGRPTVVNSIVGTGKPTLSSQSSNWGDVSGWTDTEVVRGEVVAFSVDSVSGITKLTISLDVVMV